MLYKKYHRNFVSRFKKGAKVRYNNGVKGKITIEPYYVLGTIRIIDSKYGPWTLVMSSGRLVDNINAIQKIS